MGDDAVDQRDGFVVQWHHAFGVQLAQRHLQPRALTGDLVHAVQFQVDELADAQTGRALQQQCISGQPFGAGLQRLGQAPVQIGGQVARQRPGQFGDVGAKHQAPLRRFGPAPFGDVVEQAVHRQDPAAAFGGLDRCAGAGVGRHGGRGQVGLDVAAPVQLSQTR